MTDQDFYNWWVALCAAIEPGVKIPRWSADKGPLPGAFTVIGVDADGYVRIEGPGHRIYQRLVHSSDFRVVLEVWERYCHHEIPRKEIDRITKHSPYVIGLIRWLEIK